jgi:AraC-like DNA-binding protein
LTVTAETSQPILPSATGVAARLAIAFLRARDVPIASLLGRASVSESDIDHRQRRIAAMAQGKILEYAAETLGDSEFGLHLAQKTNPREAGLLFYVSSAAEDIGDALALAARHCRIVNEAVRPKLIRSPEGMTIEIKFTGVPRHFAWQNTEFIVAAMIKGLRETAGRDFRPTQVGFTLAREPDPGEFQRFFGCPVMFSSLADQFSLSNETLAIPLITRDQHLLEALQPVCEEAAKERNTAYGTLRSSVENEVQKLLPHGKANRQRVAKALGLTERTLAQKLGEENTSYEKIVDRLRLSLGLQYIKEPNVSVAQIAWLLGYEGPTSFNHAFARWTGRSASEAQRKFSAQATAKCRSWAARHKLEPGADAPGPYAGGARCAERYAQLTVDLM